MPKVTLFTRLNCPLCDRVRDELDELGIAYLVVDVDDDAALRSELGESVPVVEVNGVNVFEGGTDPSELLVIANELGLLLPGSRP